MKRVLHSFLFACSLWTTSSHALDLETFANTLYAQTTTMSHPEQIQLVSALLRAPLNLTHLWCKHNQYSMAMLVELSALVNNLAFDTLSIAHHPRESPIHQILRISHDLCTIILILGSASRDDYDEYSAHLLEEQSHTIKRVVEYLLILAEGAAATHYSIFTQNNSPLAHKHRLIAQGCLSLAHYCTSYLHNQEHSMLAYSELGLIVASVAFLSYHMRQPDYFYDGTPLAPISKDEFKKQFSKIHQRARKIFTQKRRAQLKEAFHHDPLFEKITAKYDQHIAQLLRNLAKLLASNEFDRHSITSTLQKLKKHLLSLAELSPHRIPAQVNHVLADLNTIVNMSIS